jgi:hypothetical protein
MNPYAQLLRHNLTASTAHLRGVARVHGHDLATSFFRFVVKQLSELAQTRIVCAQGQAMVLRKKVEGQTFNCNQAVGFHHAPGGLVPEVRTLISNPLV